ncbi:RING-H2 finger protein ATL63-like [Lycium ferocissimum]|uniref:RING-H2 finger protein ATL63-like n=1 Tax=Lycium ferocissimum TaxID=112874 RepID=UPI002814CE9C|nr:RING-H2 finger protein ATL63-like [Lycium ferocissimum]
MFTSPSPPSPPPVLQLVNSSLSQSSNSLKNIIHNILSYNNNIMLAAIISLLLVILFILLLHIYAKWFLVEARNRSIRNSLSSAFHNSHSFVVDTNFSSSPIKGLERSTISTIPLFVYKDENEKQEEYGLECIICLSLFEDEDVCRKLPKCNHAFHVECIDMWLYSHSTCPICRAPVLIDKCESKI